MALDAVVESLDDTPEEIRQHYREQDGKFVLDVTPSGGLALDDVQGLKTSLQRERENARAYRDRLKPFAEEGVDLKGGKPDEWKFLDAKAARDAMRFVNDHKNSDPDKKAEEKFNLLKAQLEENQATERQALEDRSRSLLSQLEREMIDGQAIRAISEKTKVKGAVKLLLPHVRSQCRLREADGEFVVEVRDPYDPESARPSLKSGNTGKMSVAELVDEMSKSDEFAIAFTGAEAAGSGASPARRGRAGLDLEALSKLPHAERLRKMREHEAAAGNGR